MKRLSKMLALGSKMYTSVPGFEHSLPIGKTLLAYSTTLLSILVLLSSCKKDASNMPGSKSESHTKIKDGFLDANANLLPQTVKELKAARSATAKYRNIQNAISDGYSDINVVTEHMGFHYMKASLADDHFEVEKPEILVYNMKENGQIELVAVEYAVPIRLRPVTAPEGFTGDADVWTYSTVFNLWLLHAWVWEYNPDGVFNPTNPLVHLH
ncbi:MAG: hypothetical protein JWP81_1581 [Ferruginibacter sp.]|nr:hypothetical protein [Ferruginibacter sp.]